MTNEERRSYLDKNYPPSERIYAKPLVDRKKIIPIGESDEITIDLEKVCCDMQEIIEIPSNKPKPINDEGIFDRMIRYKEILIPYDSVINEGGEV